MSPRAEAAHIIINAHHAHHDIAQCDFGYIGLGCPSFNCFLLEWRRAVQSIWWEQEFLAINEVTVKAYRDDSAVQSILRTSLII